MRVLMKGNEAICEAAMAAGCKLFFGYPITPQNEIPEYMSAKIGNVGGTFVQAESEIAAINMVYGAAAAGGRVMTSSSSPGVALKQEGISYMAGARLPGLIVSVARSGPGLGGILPGQADYFMTVKGGGNGDYFMPVYAPNSVQEATDLVFTAFDVADKYRTPVTILIDGMLGQMMEPVEIKNVSKSAIEKPWATDGNSDKRERNVVNSLSLIGESLEKMNRDRFEVYDEIAKNEVMCENTVQEGDEIAIVAYGAPARICQSAIEDLRAEGVKAGLIRPITLWPYPYHVFQNLPQSVKHILVCELSMGQMVEDVKLGVLNKYPVHFYGRCGGVVFEVEEIANEVKRILSSEKGAK